MRSDNRWNLARLEVAVEELYQPDVRDSWLFVIMEDQIENYGVKNIGPLMELFLEHCWDSAAVDSILTLAQADSASLSGHIIRTYKAVDGFNLDAHVFLPPQAESSELRPAMVFFHGGSWYQGKPEWMFGACQNYAANGIVTVAVEYRLYDRHGVSPLECVSDAKSAIRWLRQNAKEFGVDPDRIAAYGFSSGGHIALCTTIPGAGDGAGEDTSISCVPNALVLSSACYDPTLDPWYVKQVRMHSAPEAGSPNHNIRTGLPPTLIIHGTADRMCPYRTAEFFAQTTREAGNRCDVEVLDGAGHFYFAEDEYRAQAGAAVRRFLQSLEYLK